MSNELITAEIENKQIEQLNMGLNNAISLIDDMVLKNYLSRLSDYEVIPLSEELEKKSIQKVRLFKITEIVHRKNESSFSKLTSVINSVASAKCALFTLIQSDGIKTDYYLGIRNLVENNSTKTSGDVLEQAIIGQFPGTRIESIYQDDLQTLISNIKADNISVVSCIGANRNTDSLAENDYIQGLEKFVISMQKKKYTAIILANPIDKSEVANLRTEYESIYSLISPFTNTVLNYGNNQNTSSSIALSEGQSKAKTVGVAETSGTSHTTTESESKTHTDSYSHTHSTSDTHTDSVSRTVGMFLGSSKSVGINMLGMSIGSGTQKGINYSKTKGHSDSHTEGDSYTKGYSDSVTHGYSKSDTTSNSHTDSNSETKSVQTSKTLSEQIGNGSSFNLQLTVQNKKLINLLEKIDKQFERLDLCESIGAWNSAAYILSDDPATVDIAASTYKSIVSGDYSGIEVSSINSWKKKPGSIEENSKNNERINQISAYVKNFIHPMFNYEIFNQKFSVTPASIVNTSELAVHMGFPRQSIRGLPVVEHAEFAKEVSIYKESITDKIENDEMIAQEISIGHIFNMGNTDFDVPVKLNIESLAMHTFIAGATGCGKSNTVYNLIKKLSSSRIPFLVIEPAKGEYKRVFGREDDVYVFGTNNALTEVLRINPFKFPEKIHVYEHIDRLIEIFNVCWPMYAAMPSVLKAALIKAYEKCGWNLETSQNSYLKNLYPSFRDLELQLSEVIETSEYSEEVKSNYKGSLLTRVSSLTNGQTGSIFSSYEIPNDILFENKVIIDLSRIGSSETKSLIMGILVMRLTEHRMATSDKSNIPLKHITVIEEAHNLLRSQNISSSQDGGNLSAKSVEMISNSIAETRTYGEGFIIVDQSPSAVDVCAIRNTNTKIIMRLPDEQDRRILGKSASLNEEQIDELAHLPKGVAVIYQNDWLQPVMSKIEKSKIEEKEFYKTDIDYSFDSMNSLFQLVRFIAKNKLIEEKEVKFNTSELENNIAVINVPGYLKILLLKYLKAYSNNHQLDIWKSELYEEQAKLISSLLNVKVEDIDKIEACSTSFSELNIELNTLTNSRIGNVDEKTLIVINECLLLNYSCESKEKGENLYNYWKSYINKMF